MRIWYNQQMEIIYEDKQIIVVHKKAGIATQTKKLAEKDLVSEIKNYLGENAYLGVIHRLDQNVEGLLVFAKDKASACSLSKQLLSEDFNKDYIAKVCGEIPAEKCMLTDYLLIDKKSNITKIVDKDTKYAKKSILEYERMQEERFLKIHLKTGRKHQIRVQLSNAGIPIVGDIKYGGGKNERLCLMAYHLSFVHPASKKRLDFELPLSLTKQW